mmetsp:Transcript_29768/g.63379  ORF Transcript_29768/g.63379 Transcript_29768/m.63379 type:complete len:268 (+) Transcript_29768:1093-1896(+)
MSSSISPTSLRMSCCRIGTCCLSFFSAMTSKSESICLIWSILALASPRRWGLGMSARMAARFLSSFRTPWDLRMERSTSENLTPGTRSASLICSMAFWTWRMGLLLLMGRALRRMARPSLVGFEEGRPASAALLPRDSARPPSRTSAWGSGDRSMASAAAVGASFWRSPPKPLPSASASLLAALAATQASLCLCCECECECGCDRAARGLAALLVPSPEEAATPLSALATMPVLPERKGVGGGEGGARRRSRKAGEEQRAIERHARR